MGDHRPLQQLPRVPDQVTRRDELAGVVFLLAVVCAVAGLFLEVALGAAVVLFLVAIALSARR